MVFSKLPLEIGGNLPKPIKNNHMSSILKITFIILFYNFNMYFIICIFTPF